MVKSTVTDDERLQQVVAAVERIRAVMATPLAPRWLELNITMAQLHVLHAVRRRGRVSGRQLAAELGVSPAAVVPVCDRLAQQGWIERSRDESDRRINWLQLTPSGLELVDGFAGRGKARITGALLRMPDDERAALVRSLDALATALEAE
jgi:DNA-binding MarR family transcriptional regulator